MTSAPFPPTVDVDGAADLMKIHPQTVLDKIASGELRAGKLGRSYVLMTADVLRHIEDAIVRETAARMRTPLKPNDPKPRRRSTTPA